MREIGREVIFQQGCFTRARIWYDGWIPNINGTFTRGWRDEKQTMVVRDIIMPIATFTVEEVISYELAS